MTFLAEASHLARLAGARAFLRFTAAEDANVITTTANRTVSSAALQPFLDAVLEQWASSAVESVQFWDLVRGNNPDKDVADILSRPDVKDAFTAPFLSAGDATKGTLSSVWDAMSGLGAQHAVEQLEALGIKAAPATARPGKFFDALQQDVNRNASSSLARISTALQNDESVQRVTADLARRNLLSTQVAGRRAYHESMMATYEAVAQAEGLLVAKQWVTTFSPGTCAMCSALHGSVVTLKGNFDKGASLNGKAIKVYRDLQAPPRHPNCRCTLVPVLLREDTPKSPRSRQPTITPSTNPRESQPRAKIAPGPNIDPNGPLVPAQAVGQPLPQVLEEQLRWLKAYAEAMFLDAQATKAFGIGVTIPAREFAKFSPTGARFAKTLGSYALPSYFDTIQRMMVFAAMWWAATQLGNEPPSFEDLQSEDLNPQETQP